ncbi:MAG: WD40/YVTN/BNR-like repeat-containing protein, partial [Candidatus Micrarchaeaceae archaeon]
SSGLPGVPLNDLQARDSLLFAATSLGIYVSSDHGRHWQGPDTTGLTIEGQFSPIITLLLNDSALLGGTAFGIVRSTDNGLTWNHLDTNSSPSSFSVLSQMGMILFSGDSNGVLRSPDGGISWTSSNQGIYIYDTGYSILSPLAYLGKNLIAKGDSLYVSTDLGAHWMRYDALNGYHVNDFAILGRYAFAATDSDGILRSSDFGATWSVLDGMTNVYPVLSLAAGAGVIYAGTHSGGVYSSSDSGTTWIQIDSRGPEAEVAANGTNVFALFWDPEGITIHTIARSTDSGNTWNDLYQPGEYRWVSRIWANNNFIFVGGSNVLSGSTIDSSTWDIGGPTIGLDTSFSFLATDSLLFYGSGGGYYGEGGGVFVSKDNGNHWDSAGLMGHNINSFLIADGYVFAGTTAGLWRRP